MYVEVNRLGTHRCCTVKPWAGGSGHDRALPRQPTSLPRRKGAARDRQQAAATANRQAGVLRLLWVIGDGRHLYSSSTPRSVRSMSMRSWRPRADG
jgi:hypothetical protein